MRKIEIPFLTGQQEGVDEKLLPHVAQRALRNVFVRKDGQLVRRRGLRALPVETADGAVDGQPREIGYPDVVLYEMDDKVGTGVLKMSRRARAGTQAEGAALVGRASNGDDLGGDHNPDLDVDEELEYAPATPFGDVRQVAIGSSRGGTVGGQVDVRADRNGTIVTMSTLTKPSPFGAGDLQEITGVLIELRDPGSLAIMQSYVALEGAELTGIVGVGLAVSRYEDLCAIVISCTQGLFFKAFRTQEPYGAYPMGGDLWPGGESGEVPFVDVSSNDAVCVLYTRSGDAVFQAASWESIREGSTGMAADFLASQSAVGVCAGPEGKMLAVTQAGGNVTFTVVTVAPGSPSSSGADETFALPTVSRMTSAFGNGLWHVVLGVRGSGDGNLWTSHHYSWDGAAVPTTLRAFGGAAPAAGLVVEEDSVWGTFSVCTGNYGDAVAEQTYSDNLESGVQIIELGTGLVFGELSNRQWSQIVALPTSRIPLVEGRYFAAVGTTDLRTNREVLLLHAFRRKVGRPVRSREGEILIPGAAVFMADAGDVRFAGFSAPPEIEVTVAHPPDPEALSAADQVQPGTYFISAVLEQRDANGRLWRSAPTAPQLLQLPDAPVGEFTGYFLTILVTAGKGAPTSRHQMTAAIYMTPCTPPDPEDGPLPLPTDTVLYRVASLQLTLGGNDGTLTYRGEVDLEETIRSRESLYAQDGVLGNDPPPSAEFLAVAMGRVWAGGLPDRSKIQASKFLVPELGVEWSNENTFFLSFPEEVKGLAAMDDTLVVLTDGGAYVVAGGGPDNRGLGNFFAQRLPGGPGCVDARSVVVNEMGVWFLSKRGIELVGRGFASAQWVGQAVRDTTDLYPVCWGACAMADGTVRFLMGGAETGGASVLLVWDQRSQGWFTYTYSDTEIDDGRAALGRLRDQVTMEDGMVLARWTGAVKKELSEDEYVFSGAEAYLETGWLRPAGINAQHQGRTVNVLGTYLGPAIISVYYAFDDGPYRDTDVVTFTLGSDRYQPGDRVALSCTPPVLKFASMKVKVAWRTDGGGARSVSLTGASIFIEAEAMGPRLGKDEQG